MAECQSVHRERPSVRRFLDPIAEELAEAEAADEEAQYSDHEPFTSFYVYGELGLKREYFVDRGMIDRGEHRDGGVLIVRDGDHRLTIEPLFADSTKLHARCQKLEQGLREVSDEVHERDVKYVPNLVLGIVHRTLKEVDELAA